ncbi:transposase InsO family protein [Arthrobacter sp. UYEF20]
MCWDNAVAESAFSSLKNEFYHHHSFTTRQSARRGVMHYIEVFYNRWRPHTNNDGLRAPTIAEVILRLRRASISASCSTLPRASKILAWFRSHLVECSSGSR